MNAIITNYQIRSKMYHFARITFISLLFQTMLFASNIDSLKSTISLLENDSLKANRYNKIADYYLRKSLDSCQVFAQKALDLSLAINYKYQTGRAYLLLGNCKYFLDEYDNANSFFAKAKSKFEAINDTLQAAKVIGNIAKIKETKGEYHQALIEHHKILGIFKELNSKKDIAYTYNNIGGIYKQLGDYDNANKFYNFSIELKKSINDSISLAGSLINLGGLHVKMGEDTSALRLFFNALDISHKFNLERNKAACFQQIAHVYITQERYSLALEYYQKSNKIYIDTNFKKGLSYNYNNIANIYYHLKNYDKALKFHSKSLTTKKEINDKKGVCTTYLNMCQINLRLENYNKAINFGNKALQLSKSLDIQYWIGDSNFSLGTAYFHNGNPNIALKYLSRSEKIFKALDAKRDLVHTYQYYSLAFNHMKNYKQALKYKTLQYELKDSVENEANTKMTLELETKYQTQQKKDSIKIQQSQLIIAQKENELQTKQITYRNIIALGSILLAGILAAFLFLFQKKNKLIALTNRQLESEKIRAETFLKEVQHRVKNNLQFAASLLDLHSRDSKNKDVQAAVSDGKNRIEAMSLLHQKLLHQQHTPTSIEMQTYLNELVENLSLAHDPQSNIELSLYVDPISLDIDKAMRIGLIVNELVTNTYKHIAKNIIKPKVDISLTGKENLRLLVRDNGKGFAADYKISNKKSFGLHLVDLLVQQLNGQLSVESNQGACYKLHFN